MTEAVISGLVSGLLVTLFVVVFHAWWVKIIVPWFEDRVYKDARIEGKWLALYPTTIELRQENVSLSRHGHEVKGNIICSTGPDEGEKYSVHGSFRNMILVLIYETSDMAKTDRGTLTLKSVSNADRLEGTLSAYTDDTDSIESVPVIWFRTKAAMDKKLAMLKKREDILEKARKKQEMDANELRHLLHEKTEDDDLCGSDSDGEVGEKSNRSGEKKDG